MALTYLSKLASSGRPDDTYEITHLRSSTGVTRDLISEVGVIAS